jgi:hypothetical protein
MSGAKARIICNAQRGAEAPLFHGTPRVQVVPSKAGRGWTPLSNLLCSPGQLQQCVNGGRVEPVAKLADNLRHPEAAEVAIAPKQSPVRCQRNNREAAFRLRFHGVETQATATTISAPRKHLRANPFRGDMISVTRGTSNSPRECSGCASVFSPQRSVRS